MAVISRAKKNLQDLPQNNKIPADKRKMSEQGWTDPKILEQPLELHRVARPLRPVKYVPTKSIVFYSKNSAPQFTYDIKIKMPIKATSVIVQVLYAALNPVDLKIYNGYTTNMNSFTGLGREFVGKITHLGKNVKDYQIDDVVMGTFFHPHLGKGTLQSSIELDVNKDVFFLKPEGLSLQEAAGGSYALGAAYSLLSTVKQLQNNTNDDVNILIYGGGSSVGMFALQILKYHYKIASKITIICSAYATNVIKAQFPELIDELIFINYLSFAKNKPSKTLSAMIQDQEIIEYVNTPGSTQTAVLSVPYTQGKYDLVLDFVGGYDLIENSSKIMNKNAEYITTVGDYKFNYRKDVYAFNNLQKNNLEMFGRSLWSKMSWDFQYTHFQFDPALKYNTSYYNDWKTHVHDMLEHQTVKVVVDKVYDWKDYKNALEYLGAGHAHGKVVLKVEVF